MEEKYNFTRFSQDLDDGYKILFIYLKNRYVLYKVKDNCYMQELVEQMSKNPVPQKAMITKKAIKQNFPYMTNLEYQSGMTDVY